MKRNYKKIAILVFGLFVFGLIGIGKVNATGFNNVAVVCVPESLEKGQEGTCYFVANGQEKQYGVYLIPAVKQLTITGFSTSQPKVTAKTLGEGGNVTDTYNGQTRELFKCNLTPGTNGSYALEDTYKSQGYNQPKSCYTLQSQDNTEHIDPQFASANQSAIDGTKKAKASVTQYHEIAAFKVKLSDDATLNNCGTLCLDVRYMEHVWTVIDSENPLSTTTANSTQDNTGFPKGYVCGEITPDGTPNKESGNFASYAVLIGGACVALIAVIVATKSKKIYNV